MLVLSVALASFSPGAAHGRDSRHRHLIVHDHRPIRAVQRPVHLHFLLRRLRRLLDLILRINHRLLLLLHTTASLAPLTATRHHWLRLQVRKQVLAHHLDDIAAREIDDHRRAQPELEGIYHLNDLQPAVELGHEVGGTGERDGACAQEAIPQCPVLADALAEWTTLPICQHTASSYIRKAYLEVDRERRHLLRQSQQVDRCVQQARFKLGLEIDGARPGLVDPRQVCNVHHRCDVQRKLQKDRKQHVKVEDVSERALLRQLLDRLWPNISTSCNQTTAYAPLLSRYIGNTRTSTCQ